MSKRLITQKSAIFIYLIFLISMVACLPPTKMDLVSPANSNRASKISRRLDRITGQITIAILQSDPAIYAKTLQRLREWQRRSVKVADLKIKIESQKFNAITTSAPLLLVSTYPPKSQAKTFFDELKAYTQRGGIVMFEQSDPLPFNGLQTSAITSDHPLLTHPFSFKGLPRQARPKGVLLQGRWIGFLLGTSPIIAPFGPIGPERNGQKGPNQARPINGDWARSLKLGLNLIVYALDNQSDY